MTRWKKFTIETLKELKKLQDLTTYEVDALDEAIETMEKVVRCEDCKYCGWWDDDLLVCENEDAPSRQSEVEPDFFCSLGKEKKEEEECQRK